MRVRHHRKLPVRGDTPSRPIAADLRHQVPAHRARRRRSGISTSGDRRHHGAGLLRLRAPAVDLRPGRAASHTVSVCVKVSRVVNFAVCCCGQRSSMRILHILFSEEYLVFYRVLF